ncbi:MAG: transketolase [Proteobacteria bacterium]|nr:transketolase [Pseudomonadota bacterium]MCP4917988.1 transketolase [Pseudomonadota bacterium]
MDAVQKANSGHPGMPMGCADMAYVLWSRFLKHDPADPTWADRDRFILSAGHGSMLLYSLLHLWDYRDESGEAAVSLDDIKDFRQWGSKTPGHPEYGHTAGVETTTGPLGQGFAMGVGMALAERYLRNRFGADVCDHNVYAIVSDGDLMEGVAAEAASLAGTLKLGKIVYLYDDNSITIDGSTDLSFTEDRSARFESYGWHTQIVDGHDHAQIAAAIEAARAETDKPSLICCRTRIGDGSPNKEGKSASHGAPLGVDEIVLTKTRLGMDPEKSFDVPADVLAHVREVAAARTELREAWETNLSLHPKRGHWELWHADPDVDGVEWPEFEVGGKIATRKASHAALNAAALGVPQLLGGSADLAGSNGSMLKGVDGISGDDFSGRNLFFGVREHAMAAMCNGMVLHGGMRPYCATFLVFHDYMRPSVRLSALMNQPVVYVYTHDSIYLGEDGPTHQPVETLMAMRTVPNLVTIRPCDGKETVGAWKAALRRNDGPTALSLTRQGLPTLEGSSIEGVEKGAYVLAEATGDHAVTLLATGSEVELAMRSREALQADGIGTRVVSFPSWELFEAQDADYKASVMGTAPRVSIEAGRTFGWKQYAQVCVGHDDFGASAPASVLMEKFGFTVDNVVAQARSLL